MQEVISTGTPFIANEHEVMLIRNGVEELLFIDFVYEPVKNIDGNVTAIMVVGIDVTQKVMARKAIEDVEERIRLAVEAAEIGTFDLYYKTGEVVASDRFNEIFDVENAYT
jgi:PAS domain-containing protein